jgi:CDP-glucose 4,6-dehydratase
MNRDFWSGRRTFVTGHTGFKGAWLALWLHQLGARLTGYALPNPSASSTFVSAAIDKCVDSTYADIRDLEQLRKTMAAARPEIVFHMAAQPLVRPSYQDPIGTYSTNVMGVVHLLEAVRSTPTVKAVVVVTSDKCYRNQEWLWGYRESEPMGGFDPYSSSKGCAELITDAYRSSYFHPERYTDHGVAIASARAGNVIGGGDWAPDRLIPDFVRAMMDDKELLVRSPHAVRPWQHVLEPLCGYMSLAEQLVVTGPRVCEAWNFGPHEHDARPVAWLVDRLVKLWGENARWRVDDNAHPHEAHHLKLDISKARAHLHWEPRWSLDEALKKVVDWYRALRHGCEMRNVCLGQIEAYERAGD